MRKNRGVTIVIGIIFGFAAYAVTVYFTAPQFALTAGVFTAALYILVLSLIMDSINNRPYSV